MAHCCAVRKSLRCLQTEENTTAAADVFCTNQNVFSTLDVPSVSFLSSTPVLGIFHEAFLDTYAQSLHQER